jgi:S-formylglutathione hydrolase FrmB
VTAQFFGNSIQKATSLCAILPNKPGRFPVLYLLHGLSDDHTMWHRRTRIEWYVRDLPLIVVCPDGHRSWYCNQPWPGGMAYEDHIYKDVVGYVDQTFPTIPAARSRAIAGLSMGGFGAMMLAMRHPDVFRTAVSHSGAVQVTAKNLANRPDLTAIIDGSPKGAYDCFALARKLARSRKTLNLRLDCGTEDFLIEHNRAFHAHLGKLGVAHEYAEHPGTHDWDYWDAHIQETLQFVTRKVARASRP